MKPPSPPAAHLILSLLSSLTVGPSVVAQPRALSAPRTPADRTARPAAQTIPRHYSARGCAGCHPDHYGQWKVSLHALSHVEPVYDRYFIRASRDSEQRIELFCGRCHTPIAALSGEIPFARAPRTPRDTEVAPVATEGVQCDFCHTITGHTELQNGGFVSTPSTVKRGPLPDPQPRTHGARHDPSYRSAEICGTCHQVTHPDNGIKLETTYSEWRAGPYAAAGVVCQDCHMAATLPRLERGRVVGAERSPGRAATGAAPRPHISHHGFVGPTLIFATGEASAELRRRSEALLRSAGDIEVTGARRVGDEIEIDVVVTNTGAGHDLPTGVTELRQLWIELRVRDRRGRTLLHSGALDAEGHIAPGSVVYRTVIRDAEGRDTTLFWNIVKKVSDRRIPPLESVAERFRCPAPRGRRITVEAALHYRSVPPWGLAEAGVPPGTVEVPVFTISRQRRSLSL